MSGCRCRGQLAVGSGVAVNSATGEVYVADAANNVVDAFGPEPAGTPSVSGLSAQNLTPSSARLSAAVDPHGADTHFYFQYGTADCVSSPGSCTDVPAAPGTDVGAGFADQAVSVELSGLAASTTYRYRLIAVNVDGQAEGAQTFGSITTLPSAEGLFAGRPGVGARLATGKGWFGDRTFAQRRRPDPGL